MKCDQCLKAFEDGQGYLVTIGSFGRPLFFCDSRCSYNFRTDQAPDDPLAEVA